MTTSRKLTEGNRYSWEFSEHKKLLITLTPLFFIFISYVIYFPVLSRYFVSDDFIILKRVCHDRIFFTKSGFRPLSDLTIFANYQIKGLTPLVFNSFGILIHGINSCLIYIFCCYINITDNKKDQNQFALISAALFMCYPFHNEAVVWLLGRGASMACLFILFSLISFYWIKNVNLKAFIVCLCYFISLTAFESTLIFPFIFSLVLIIESQSPRSIRTWNLRFVLTFLIYVLVRVQAGGVLLPGYEENFLHARPTEYLINVMRVFIRLLLPPTRKTVVLALGFFLVLSVVLTGIYFCIQKKEWRHKRMSLVFFFAMLIFACLAPFITGVSTQTSESDRMLYFPSLFLSMLVSLILTCYIKKNNLRLILLFLLLIYQVIFLEINNQNWIKASYVTESILIKAKSFCRDNTKGKIYFLNIPNEINGAYVFRQGFNDALKLLTLDSTRVIPVNYLPRQDLQLMGSRYNPDTTKSDYFIPPNIILKKNQSACRDIYDHRVFAFHSFPEDKIFYWNVNDLDSIPACR